MAELLAHVRQVAVAEHRADERRPGDGEHPCSGSDRDKREPRGRDDVARDPDRGPARSE